MHQKSLFIFIFIFIFFTTFLGLRSSIEKRSDGSIYATDVLSVLPFENDLYIVKITGKTILKALEHSASMEAKDSNGGFLQMSGVHTIYDYNKDIGSRVISAQVRCAECKVPTFEPLKEEKYYNVIIQKFLLNGGDGHNFVEDDGPKAQRLQKNDYEALLQYLKQREFIYPEIEERITIITKNIGDDNNSGSNEGGGDAGVAISVSKSILVLAIIALMSNYSFFTRM